MGSTKRKYNKGINIELTAMAVAAGKAGMTYGKFINQLSAEEKLRIIREYKKKLNIEQDFEETEELLTHQNSPDLF